MKKSLLKGKELRFAAENSLPVLYVERHHNPQDKHMNFSGICTMEKAVVGYYIGNADIDPDEFKDNQLVRRDFSEGEFSVHRVKGVNYTT